MSAFPTVRVRDHAKHGLLLEDRHGAGDEDTGSDFAGRERYEQFGYESLFDKRRGQPSPKRVPYATVEKVLALYREKYFDLNVRHFHEKLREQHAMELSYTWVKTVLQGAGLVARQRQRGVHR